VLHLRVHILHAERDPHTCCDDALKGGLFVALTFEIRAITSIWLILDTLC